MKRTHLFIITAACIVTVLVGSFAVHTYAFEIHNQGNVWTNIHSDSNSGDNQQGVGGNTNGAGSGNGVSDGNTIHSGDSNTTTKVGQFTNTNIQIQVPTPTASPTNVPTATPTPGGSGNGGNNGGSSNGSSSSTSSSPSSNSPIQAVLGLSDTAGNNFPTEELSILGLVCIAAGFILYKKSLVL
ncbi:MAG TPA: hypothetical protein VN711_02840 [Candidatus Saccharimonadales bacterium]|nr:hypothetical protein [Candidatus Saccharimonadales bacterium]